MHDEVAILAVDGGSSKTDAVAVRADGRLLGHGRAGPSNYQLVGIDHAMDTIGEALRAALASAGLPFGDHPLSATGVYCLAGVDLAVDEERLGMAIAHRGWTRTDLLRNDTFAVSRAGTTSSWGVGVVCGSGMNCAASGPDGSTVRFPALAELSGDFAPGGSWLGVRALGLALRAGDGRGAPTALRHRVPEHYGLPDAESVLSAVYTGSIDYGRLFELAEVLLDAAADGDAEARRAADLLADEVVAFVRAAITRLQVADTAVEVVLGGGIFETRDGGFQSRVESGILAVAPRARVRRLTAPPVLGAALLGLDALGAGEDAKARIRRALEHT